MLAPICFSRKVAVRLRQKGWHIGCPLFVLTILYFNGVLYSVPELSANMRFCFSFFNYPIIERAHDFCVRFHSITATISLLFQRDTRKIICFFNSETPNKQIG